MQDPLDYDEQAVLFAVYYASKQLGEKCVNPQQISEFFVIASRTGNLEVWQKVVDVAEQLVSKSYLRQCVPRIRIEEYHGYELTDKGEDYVLGFQPGEVRKGV